MTIFRQGAWGPTAGKNPGAECEWRNGSVGGPRGGRRVSKWLAVVTPVFYWTG